MHALDSVIYDCGMGHADILIAQHKDGAQVIGCDRNIAFLEAVKADLGIVRVGEVRSEEGVNGG